MYCSLDIDHSFCVASANIYMSAIQAIKHIALYDNVFLLFWKCGRQFGRYQKSNKKP